MHLFFRGGRSYPHTVVKHQTHFWGTTLLSLPPFPSFSSPFFPKSLLQLTLLPPDTHWTPTPPSAPTSGLEELLACPQPEPNSSLAWPHGTFSLDETKIPGASGLSWLWLPPCCCMVWYMRHFTSFSSLVVTNPSSFSSSDLTSTSEWSEWAKLHAGTFTLP